ncbi:MAG TPA: hypothetical protein VJ951_12305 [Bacteroidales bacterium]|nr:hypothetical protein [Bacteroidales bacterium]
MKQFRLLMISTLLLLMTGVSYGSNGITNSDNGIEPVMQSDYSQTALSLETAIHAKNDKNGFGKLFSWVKKKAVKLVDKVAAIGGLGDPVDKWFWFWVLGWGAWIVLSIVASAIVVGSAFGSGFGIGALLFLIAYLAGLFGTVSLIVWLIKKFS